MVAVSKIAREKGIRYFLISFSDLAGVAPLQAGAGRRDR